MERKVVKPITIERHELMQNITNLINSCNLPFFVIEEILSSFHKEVKTLAERQLQIDMEKYSAAVAAQINIDDDHEDK